MQVLAAETVDPSTTIVEGDSCEPAAAHSCCTKPEARKQRVRTKTPVTTQKEAPVTTQSGSLTTAPRGMSDCPLMINGTAVTAKSSGNVPEPGRTPVALLPRIENQIAQAPVISTFTYRPNRGPTHLRCCVFLI
jgi:hypothetical protein